ncbi:MAG: haloacid dehalogenase-like hydrolase, partial [Muribaculaceae bacterium]|nr:haloacid dehalogenase-like hydrolase [Muribaculaceae bacterium]
KMLKAVVYDFDGTLTPEPVPKFKILEQSGLEGGTGNPKFFAMVRELSQREKIDIYRAIVLVILDIVGKAGFPLTDESIGLGASERAFNPGVEGFFDRLQRKGIKNYLLSSGSQAYLKQLKIAPYFTKIYATTLSYDEDGIVTGIEHVMTDTEKAVALQEIALQLNGNKDDFSGIVYVGDGPTDVDAMKHIKQYGGGAILVKPKAGESNLPDFDTDMVDLVTETDFTEDSELAAYIKDIITS